MCHPDRPQNAKGLCNTCYVRKWSRQYPGRRIAGRQKVSADERAAIVAAQGGGCAICAAPSPSCLDHDHSTGKPRGMLCQNCNSGIGKLKDDPAVLRQAVEYLEAYR